MIPQENPKSERPASQHSSCPSWEEEDSNFATYFVGPRDLAHHSKWPTCLQLHGSVAPYMVLPLILTGAWATAVTCISRLVHHIGINHVLLTVLGFVVGLSLSFRGSTAYERYSEGRKYWAQLVLATQNLARLIWVHADERDESQTEDLLGKVTFCNMLVTFAVALKHRLRFEPYSQYEDLQPRLEHLSVFAKKATLQEWKEPSRLKLLGSGVASTDVNDTLVGTDRILNTPMPKAYEIAIAQITWVYILILPCQLVDTLGWVTIPGTLCAAYIILGLALIGQDIENPFGEDVNDLPLDGYCEQIRRDIDIILGGKTLTVESFIARDEILLFHPMTNHGFHSLKSKTTDEIREMLRMKVTLAPKD
ncbi:UPF0187 domain membrane [Fusarium albosuccineum]|uniref:UPF0187 domain membrane n=1 Tax=Fusarium albosuccineum TaxID=1237068 RepID=A0A8H4P8G8_9HYPO|nr:UPF0187 domain membrane [Fusarium albosuccineum]